LYKVRATSKCDNHIYREYIGHKNADAYNSIEINLGIVQLGTKFYNYAYFMNNMLNVNFCGKTGSSGNPSGKIRNFGGKPEKLVLPIFWYGCLTFIHKPF